MCIFGFLKSPWMDHNFLSLSRFTLSTPPGKCPWFPSRGGWAAGNWFARGSCGNQVWPACPPNPGQGLRSLTGFSSSLQSSGNSLLRTLSTFGSVFQRKIMLILQFGWETAATPGRHTSSVSLTTTPESALSLEVPTWNNRIKRFSSPNFLADGAF